MSVRPTNNGEKDSSEMIDQPQASEPQVNAETSQETPQKQLSLDTIEADESFNYEAEPLPSYDEPQSKRPSYEEKVRNVQRARHQSKHSQPQIDPRVFHAVKQNDPAAALQALGFDPYTAFESLTASLGNENYSQPNYNNNSWANNQQSPNSRGADYGDYVDFGGELEDLKSQLREQREIMQREKHENQQREIQQRNQNQLRNQAIKYEEALWNEADASKDALPYLSRLQSRDQAKAEKAVTDVVLEYYNKNGGKFPNKTKVLELVESQLEYQANLWRDEAPQQRPQPNYNNPQLRRESARPPSRSLSEDGLDSMLADSSNRGSNAKGDEFSHLSPARALLERAQRASGRRLVDDEDFF